MEDLFEFMFGAGGRIDLAKYWLSLFKFGIAGLLAAVILFSAAGIAAPLFIITVVLVFIPWLLWGFAIHTERLHERDKSAWWLVIFCLIPGVLGQLGNGVWFAGAAGTALQNFLALAACADGLGIYRNWLSARHRRIEHIWPRPALANQTAGLNAAAQKTKKARWPWATGRELQPGKNSVRTDCGPNRSRFKQSNHRLASPATLAVGSVPKAPASESAAMRASS